MASELSRVKVVVSMSEFETQPIAVLEARALGCRPAVADTPGLSALAVDGLARAVPFESAPEEIASIVLEELARPGMAEPVRTSNVGRMRRRASYAIRIGHARRVLARQLVLDLLREDHVMRVLLATDNYPPYIGGAQIQSHFLAAELRDRGHEVIVATVWQSGLPSTEDDNGVRVSSLTTAAHIARSLRGSAGSIISLRFLIR